MEVISRTKMGVAAGILLLSLLVVAWSDYRSHKSADLPSLSEIDFIDFDLMGELIGESTRLGCRLGESDQQTLFHLLTPSESSKSAEQMVRGVPRLAEIRIHLRTGRIVVLAIAEGGKNPLCFTVDGQGYIRGGENYPHYRRDHRTDYAIDSESIDESLMLGRKLDEFCNIARRETPQNR